MYNTQWEPVSEELVDREELKIRALEFFSNLDYNLDEILDVSVKRIVSQSEDDEGNDLGPLKTAGYIVYITRKLGNYPVFGASFKVVFNSKGELHKINAKWRKTENIPIDYNYISQTEQLNEKCKMLVEIIGSGLDLTQFSTQLAYIEKPYKETQERFSLQMVYFYSFGSFLYRDSIDASETE